MPPTKAGEPSLLTIPAARLPSLVGSMTRTPDQVPGTTRQHNSSHPRTSLRNGTFARSETIEHFPTATSEIPEVSSFEARNVNSTRTETHSDSVYELVLAKAKPDADESPETSGNAHIHKITPKRIRRVIIGKQRRSNSVDSKQQCIAVSNRTIDLYVRCTRGKARQESSA